jgi:hypothetical protein
MGVDAGTRRLGTADLVTADSAVYLFDRGWRHDGAGRLEHPEALYGASSVAEALSITAAWDQRLLDAAAGSGYLAETCPPALPEGFA